MAYRNFLAAVPPEQVASFRGDKRTRLRPSRLTAVSHLIGMPGWVDAQPLQTLLARAIDGGEILAPWLWHPLRVPVYHAPATVGDLAVVLADVWNVFLGEHALPEDDWYRLEIGRAIGLFVYAAERCEGVASILEPPGDPERARRVEFPLEMPLSQD